MTDEDMETDGLPASTVGQRLAAARQARGLSPREVADATRIPIRYIETIESGAYLDLPAPTYSAGFVKSYARLVGLDGQALSDAFRVESGQTAAQRHQPAAYEPADPARTPPRWLALLALLVAVVGGLGYLYWRGSTDQPGELAATSSDLPVAAAPPPASSPGPAAGAPVATAPAASGAGGPVVVAAANDVWLKISDGGATLFMGVLKGGDRFEVPASAVDPMMTTGRPGATRVTVGDRIVPTLGDPDRIAKNVSLKPDALLARRDAAPADPSAAPAPDGNSAGPA